MGVQDGSGAIKSIRQDMYVQKITVSKRRTGDPPDTRHLIFSEPQFTALKNGDNDSCLTIF